MRCLRSWSSERLNAATSRPEARLLDTIDRDYVLQVDPAKLNAQTVWVISGTLKESVRKATLKESGRDQWPELYPTRVRVAVAAEGDPESGFGGLLPSRIEFARSSLSR